MSRPIPGAASAARGIRSQETTSAELVRSCIDRMSEAERLNAFTAIDISGALAAATTADEAVQAGVRLGPLHGVPIAVKDNIRVAGMPTTAGTPALAGYETADDAPVVATLRKAGAIVLAKTNMHELAFGISGYNPAFHAAEIGVRNPFDPSKSAGGSSSGSGVVVATGAACAALGTDTGGSVRIPAALCGVVGFRPTTGRYRRDGTVPISRTRDTIGPMGAGVNDVQLLDAVLTGDYSTPQVRIDELRLGVPRAMFWDELDADTREALGEAVSMLEAAGATIVVVDTADLVELNDGIGATIAIFEASESLAEYLGRYSIPLKIHELVEDIASPDVLETYTEMILPGRVPSAGGWTAVSDLYESAMTVTRPALQRAYEDVFGRGIDAIVLPTTPSVAMPQGPEASSAENFRHFIRNTDPGSHAGIPGISVPAGLGRTSRLPVGLEIDGPAGSDRRLLAVAAAVANVLAPAPFPPRAPERWTAE